MKIGVLAYQGSVAEHISCLNKIPGIEPVRIKHPEELESIKGLILPGGESTTMGKLLREYSLIDPIRYAHKKGMPIWGTCAGLILMAEQISESSDIHLGIMGIKVRRNAYGTQINSFTTSTVIPAVSAEEIPIVFIRAPIIEEVYKNTKVLCTISGRIVAAQQNNLLATSFHPELTENLAFHNYYINMVKSARI